MDTTPLNQENAEEQNVQEENVEEENVEEENVQEENVEEEGDDIWYASRDGDLQRVQYLVERKGTDINSRQWGSTAFIWASKYGELPIVKYLAEHGADMNAVDYDGWTAFMHASKYGKLPVLEHLAKHGADMDLADKDGNSALDQALTGNKTDVVKVLLRLCPPSCILASAKKYPTPLYTALSELLPEKCNSCFMVNSHLLYEGEKRYRGCSDGSRFTGDYDYTIQEWVNNADTIYDDHSLQLRMRTKFARGSIPVYRATEYLLPLNTPTDSAMLKACVTVSISLSNPKLFDSHTVIGDAVEAAWQQHGRTNHLLMTGLYIFYLGIMTVLNYTFHAWIEDSQFFTLTMVMMFVIPYLTGFFMFLEGKQIKAHYRDNTLFGGYLSDGENVLDWMAYLLVYVGCFFRILYLRETNISASVMAVATVLLWLKLTHFLRPFQSTGPLVRMMFLIMYKIKELLVILTLVVFAFSQAVYLLSYEAEGVEFSDPFSGLMQSFVYMMGQIDLAQLHETSNPKLAQFLLVVFSISSSILILNLVIAVMNSAYTEIANNEVAEWNRERAIIIAEQWYFNHPEMMPQQLYLIRDDDVKKQAEAKEHKALDLKILKESEARVVEKMEEKMKASDLKMEETMNASDLKMEAKMSASEARVVEKVEKVEEKMKASEEKIASVLGVVNGLQKELDEVKASNQRVESALMELMKAVASK